MCAGECGWEVEAQNAAGAERLPLLCCRVLWQRAAQSARVRRQQLGPAAHLGSVARPRWQVALAVGEVEGEALHARLFFTAQGSRVGRWLRSFGCPLLHSRLQLGGRRAVHIHAWCDRCGDVQLVEQLSNRCNRAAVVGGRARQAGPCGSGVDGSLCSRDGELHHERGGRVDLRSAAGSERGCHGGVCALRRRLAARLRLLLGGAGGDGGLLGGAPLLLWRCVVCQSRCAGGECGGRLGELSLGTGAGFRLGRPRCLLLPCWGRSLGSGRGGQRGGGGGRAVCRRAGRRCGGGSGALARLGAAVVAARHRYLLCCCRPGGPRRLTLSPSGVSLAALAAAGSVEAFVHRRRWRRGGGGGLVHQFRLVVVAVIAVISLRQLDVAVSGGCVAPARLRRRCGRAVHRAGGGRVAGRVSPGGRVRLD